jgi:hypothetical protein
VAKKNKNESSTTLAEVATGSGGMFLIIFVGLFLMLVSSTCAEVGVDYALHSEDLAEKAITIPLSAMAALVGAGLATGAFSFVSVLISGGYRMLLGGVGAGVSRREHLAGGAMGIGTMLVSAALGGWRMQAGYSGGEPGWVMQGTVVAAAGVIVGFMLALPSLALAIRSPSKPGTSSPKRADSEDESEDESKDESKDDDAFPSEVVFVFLAVVGIVMSYGVVEYVHIARAQAGEGPLPMAEFVDGWVRDDGFQGYPEEAELTLPAGLDGPHAIVFIEVNECTMKLTHGDDKAVKVKRVAKKTDEDGDTTAYARLVFKAKKRRRYRLQLTASGNDCMYSVRLVKKGSQ